MGGGGLGRFGNNNKWRFGHAVRQLVRPQDVVPLPILAIFSRTLLA